MGLVARLLSVLSGSKNDVKYNDVKVDAGGDNNLTVQHFQPSGEDSKPLKNDYVMVVEIPRTGGAVAVGYLDPQNEPQAADGEKRLYSRNANGEPITTLWLKNDGGCTIFNDKGVFELAADGSQKGSNDNGSFELEAGGIFKVNGVSIDTNGNISVPGDVSVDGGVDAGDDVLAGNISLKGHVHPGVQTGSGTTGGPK